MGRKSFQITSLYGYKVEELVELKNTTNSRYSRLALTVITMRYCGYSNNDIIVATGLSKASIVKHIKEWNSNGLKSTKDHRGGSESKLEAEIIDNLVETATRKSPKDFDFTSNNWTCGLLALYIEKNYGVKVSAETIRLKLKLNNLSYKRAQPKPTKANKDEQEAFKKNIRPTIYFRIFI